MREKWSERKSDCTRDGGASSTRNADFSFHRNSTAACWRVFRFWRLFRFGLLSCLWDAHMITAGIVGGTGYTGVELLRLLARHPQVTLRVITSRKEAGSAVAAMFP